MNIQEVVNAAQKNHCKVFVDGTEYESVVERENIVELWEIRDRYQDREPADLSFPSDAPVRIVEGCAVATGEDGSDYTIELYQLAKFHIL